MTILGANGEELKTKVQSPNRAERRRMKRDPLSRDKILCTTEGVPEFWRLVSYGRVLVWRLSDIQMRMMGIGYIPKKYRMKRQEELTMEWEQAGEALEALQKRLEELEDIQKIEERKNEEAVPAKA